MIGVNRRALRRSHALDIDQVLDRDRHAGKLAAVFDWLLHQAVHVLPRPVEAARRQRVHGAVDLSDTLFQRVEQVVWRHLAALEARHDGYGILADQLVAHSDFPGSWKGLQSLVLAAGTAAVHANAE